ncbi:gastrula zinc finger protein XlCGF26.1-like [Acanthopagrus latus]|uniref:gastrula zinc finger protein XlCGF26.1-like n=1 Tax=Acanthopagrus latus TaxID=8177 RepID=UPI00187CBBA9|nr:gastrula zinc finger protein XlCGF26.1-like [Acanthopagrus latus]
MNEDVKRAEASSTPSNKRLRQSSTSASDVQELLVIKEEVSPAWSTSLDQEDPEPLHIKEEQEELLINSKEGEQLNGLEEADSTSFEFTVVTVKSEDDEDKPQPSQLHQSQTETNREAKPPTSSSETQMKTESDGEDCGGSEPARNQDPDSHPQLNTSKKAVDCSETDVSSDDWQEPLSDSGSETEETDNGWEETRAPESGVNALKYNEAPVNETGCHTGKNSLSCFESSKGLCYKGSLQRHTSHLEKRSSGCLEDDKCCGVTRTDDSLTRVNAGLKPHGCDVCGKRFTFLGNFQNHMRVHTGEKPFGCDDCGKRFSQQTNLKAHMRVHTGDKPFGCDHCSVRFTFKTNLEKHMRVHTGEKPFGCADCGKRFRQKTILKTHMRVHTGERPFGCEVCGKRFTQRGNLKKHMKLH